MRISTAVVPLGAAALAALWISLGDWGKIGGGLLAFLGLIAAGLVQIIPPTIMFLDPDHVTPAQAREFNRQLEALQDYWLGLLVMTVLAAALLILAQLLDGHTILTLPSVGWWPVGWPTSIDIAPPVSALTAALVVLVGQRAVGAVPLVRLLQRQRSAIVLEAAGRRIREQQQVQDAASSNSRRNVVPDNYGDIIRH